MNVVKCANGHFFDADKYKFCPICGMAIRNNDNITQSVKPERTDMVMGMMKPPESVIRGNMRCVDEFISEDPIDYTQSGLIDCKHRLAKDFSIKTGFDEIGYSCDKCGHIAIFNRFRAKEFIKQYADCEISNTFYVFPDKKRNKSIVSFSASFFEFPHKNFTFDGNAITYFHSISPRDGGLQYAPDFFDKHKVELSKKQIKKIYDFLKKIDFSMWESQQIYDAYDLMIGASSYNTFSCEFFNGTEYSCIFNSNDNEAFKSLYTFLVELCNINPNSF